MTCGNFIICNNLHFGMLNRIAKDEGQRDGSGTILTEGKARKAAGGGKRYWDIR